MQIYRKVTLRILRQHIFSHLVIMAESELSREELKLAKEKWKVKSKVEIYSSSMQKWVKGHIVRIFEDEEGEWLVIKYGANNEKEIQRYSQGIRPIKSVKSKRKKVQIPNTSLCFTYSPIPSDFPSFSLQKNYRTKRRKQSQNVNRHSVMLSK